MSSLLSQNLFNQSQNQQSFHHNPQQNFPFKIQNPVTQFNYSLLHVTHFIPQSPQERFTWEPVIKRER